MVRNPYDAVRDLVSEAQFTANVAATIEAWGGLLDEDAAGLLVAAQLGRDIVAYGRVAELQEGLEATLKVVVDEVVPVREFARQDGTRGRVANLLVHDDSGKCLVVLWDDDVEIPAKLGLRPGSALRVVDGFVRRTNFGLEVGRGRFGRLLPG